MRFFKCVIGSLLWGVFFHALANCSDFYPNGAKYSVNWGGNAWEWTVINCNNSKPSILYLSGIKNGSGITSKFTVYFNKPNFAEFGGDMITSDGYHYSVAGFLSDRKGGGTYTDFNRPYIPPVNWIANRE